jgi:hypothetical protein
MVQYHVTLALLPIRAGFPVFWNASQKRYTATQPHSHRSSVSSDSLPLSYFKLDVRGLSSALPIGGRVISTRAPQPLELKRSARDRTMI